MKNILVSFTLIVLVASCNNNIIKLGTYKNRRTITTKTLVIQKNNRFQYKFPEEMITYRSVGSWSVKDTILTLNSDDSVTSLNGSVIESYSAEKKSKISTLNFDGLPLPNVEVLVNNKLKFRSDKDGLIIVQDTIHTLFFKFYEDYYFFYRKKKLENNTFVFTSKAIQTSEIHFQDVKFIIRKNKLVSAANEVYIRQ